MGRGGRRRAADRPTRPPWSPRRAAPGGASAGGRVLAARLLSGPPKVALFHMRSFQIHVQIALN
eukprot:9675912-Alexandrium_andersonii.AAC.1